MEKEQYNMHLIMNTHWDREFRWSFCETQMRLVEAVDILLEAMEKDSRFTYFHTDSQVSFLDDYLEAKPENRSRVEALVRAGRLLSGPWYTLPAAFLVSGEALVRNLLMGHRMANDLGGVMKCAYNIFSWGQVSQLPQIYRQFGMDTIMFYRGIDQSNIDRLEFLWKAPDGTEALGITFGEYHRLNFWAFVYKPYLAGKAGGGVDLESIAEAGGFVFHSHNPNSFVVGQPREKSLPAALEGMEQLLDTIKDKSQTNHLALFQGFDLENPDPEVPDLVDRLNAEVEYGKITNSSLPDYVSKVRKALIENGAMESLATLEGEMLSVERSGDPFAPLYAGVFSARMPLKQKNSHNQFLLEKVAEPFSVFSMMLGNGYPDAFLHKAWKLLLQNQQHDGIGGVHIDRVTHTMDERGRDVEDLCEGIAGRALKEVVAAIDYSHLAEKELGLTIFNNAPAEQTGVVSVSVDVPVEWGLSRMEGLPYRLDLSVDVLDANGTPVEHQVLDREDEVRCAYLKFGSHINYEASKLTLALRVEKIPALGYACFTVRPRVRPDRPVACLSPEFGRLENELLKVEIAENGSIHLLHKPTGKTYRNLHLFEDSGESGGPLIHVPPGRNEIFRTTGLAAKVSQLCNGPLMSSYCIEYAWPLPESVESELKIRVPNGQELLEHGTLRRSDRQKVLKIKIKVVLRKDSPLLEFETTVENTIKDHRLRVLFPTGLSEAAESRADSAFDIMRRPISVPDSTGWFEAALKTYPVQSFVDVHHADCGLAVIVSGLSEYEVIDDETRSIAITLLRCFGTSGAPFETYESQPLAQCQGTQKFRYALMPHAGDCLDAKVPQAAQRFNAPMRFAVCTRHVGRLPSRQSFIELDDDRFIVTCVKKAEYSDAILLRGYNPAAESLSVQVTLSNSIQSVEKVMLEEVKGEPLELEDCTRFSIGVKPGEIYSCLIRLAGTV